MSDPDTIYLQPECCADPYDGRLWCEDDAPEDCEDGVPWTKYVIAARVRELEGEQDKLLERIEDLEWENKGIAEWREFGTQALAKATEQRERAERLRALLLQVRHHGPLPRGLQDAIDAALAGEKP